MRLEDAAKKLGELEQKMAAYDYAMGVLYCDGATAAPRGATAGRGAAMALLSEQSHRLFASDDAGELLEWLGGNAQDADPPLRRRVEILREAYAKVRSVPVDEYVAFSVLRNESEAAWKKAKAESDYPSFEPYLSRILETLKRFARYYGPGRDPYEVWLDEHEKGLTRAACEQFFAAVRGGLVPLIREISAVPKIDASPLIGSFPVERQRRLSAWAMQAMRIDPERSAIGETEHPFTSGLNRNDVRITTHYYEDSIMPALYSTIHEGGHALYELGCNPAYADTCIAGPRSTSIHESQSRFFENYIGRSRAFIAFLLPKLRELFPETFGQMGAEALYRMANRAEPSLIRIEADELTYSLHIMARYELEKMLFDGALSTKDLPEAWNGMYREYLGIEPPDDARGVLQDTHWSGGMMGYFPSYSLGSAYAAQMLAAMEKDIDVFGCAGRGELGPIVEWLG
ncbi:MAG: carboxypeptidase M32, partial [Clostridiales bacterium]|nr:carboxypeptidase M32 [Clostridiales bacterium]